MKTTLKITLVLALFCTPLMAGDGNQSSGGRECDPNVETCSAAQIGGLNDGDATLSIKDVLVGLFDEIGTVLRF